MRGFDLLLLKHELGIASNAELARQLGISSRNFYRLLLKDALPRDLTLAAAALKAGLAPYSPPDSYDHDHFIAENRSTLDWIALRIRERQLTCDPGTDILTDLEVVTE